MLRRLKNLYYLTRAIFANFYYKFPGRKLTVVGVTGTDGKTTTTNLIYHVLLTTGHKVGKITTIDSSINGKIISESLHTTTPDSFVLQKFLAQCVDDGCKFCVVEVSSHGIDQNRIWGIPFEVGVLTNIANNEHLDYHGSFVDYKNTKIKFVRSAKHSVIDANGLTDANFVFKSPLLGKFNMENCLTAVATCKLLGLEDKEIADSVASFQAPKGRMEVVQSTPFCVIIDFAHTPQAFEKVLPVAKELCKKSGRLIHVFGATGNRDKNKRPVMSKIASQFDDYIILTHEDTYNENMDTIISMLENGLLERSYKTYEVIKDRRVAIEKAIEKASAGDVVLITGVGHQKSMNIGGKEIEWSDAEISKEILKKTND